MARQSNPKRRTSAEYREEQRAKRAQAVARKRTLETSYVDDDDYEEDED